MYLFCLTVLSILTCYINKYMFCLILLHGLVWQAYVGNCMGIPWIGALCNSTQIMQIEMFKTSPRTSKTVQK